MHYRLQKEAKRVPGVLVACAFAAAFMTATAAFSQTSPGSGQTTTGPSPAEAVSLDGRQFSAGIVREGDEEDSKSQPLVDKLMFADGKFSSEVCRRYNFADAPYWVRVEGDRVHFLAELTSPTDGRMLWKGTIRGDTLEGTMRWTKKRWYWTIDTEHTIRGKLSKPGAASALAQ